jgi:uncharacterized membrane protein (Fun14 family)
MIILPLDLVSELIGLISGSIGGIPTLALMAIPLIIGLILGFLFKKVLKWVIIFGIIAIIVAYFGFFGLSIASLQDMATTYGPMAIQASIALFGLLPLGIGFVIGFILGFLFS